MNQSDNSPKELKGYVHSIQTLGALDGPGLRTVIFFQGCPLKCKFCHNIDMSPSKTGKEYTVSELVDEVLKYKEYWGQTWQNKGGVTLSGGEPTYQSPFTIELVKALKKHSVNVALDTCFGTSKLVIEKFAPYVDYWMVSLKHMIREEHLKLTGVFNEHILENIRFLDSILARKENSRLRIRYLIVPTLTDSEKNINLLGEFVSSLKSLDCLEILKYGTHGKYKWVENFGEYPLEGIRDANNDDVERAKDLLAPFKITIKS